MPFPAIVGQEELKLGLILNLIDPGIGGLLIRGPKGTGKSTAVYSLARLMPERRVVPGCPYHCDPKDPDFLCASCRSVERPETGITSMRVVSLPLSTSEDRLVGSVDMGRMLGEGEKAFQPGILAEANGNVLYVDEINLLPDHIADDILDAAASGWSTVEREGFSVTHPARFVLVGTMNPEEGELRPQLLDRLPLSVTLETIDDPKLRVEIITRNLAAARDHDGLREEYAAKEGELSGRIAAARRALTGVGIHTAHLLATAEACVALGVDGHRPEIVITKTAIALAAFNGRDRVEPEDVQAASLLALGHRTRGGGFEPPATRDEIGKAFDAAFRKHRDAGGEVILPGVKKKS
jgi:Mg-chelatase subunit ChlI